MASVPYTWAKGAGRYRAPNGRFVPFERINALLEDRMQQAAERMGIASGRLKAGSITVSEWQQAMAEELRHVHIAGTALGQGGWHAMDAEKRAWTQNRIQRELGYLDRFASQIADGTQPLNGAFDVRASMYASSGWSTYQESRRAQQYEAGKSWERNVLTALENCDGCLEATARGWVTIGSLPAIGERICLSNCRCFLDFADGSERPTD